MRADTLARMSPLGKKLQVSAYFMLGGGFVLSALAHIVNGSGVDDLKGLGDAPTPNDKLLRLPAAKLPTKVAQLPASGVRTKPTLKQYDIGDIDTRVGLIGELIRKGSLNADLRERVVEMLASKCDALGRIAPGSGKWCVKEKDCLGEAQALFEYVRNPKSKFAVRYTRDAMLADVFTAPERTLFKTHGGDCDDYVITLGSMLMAVGHPVRLRVVATRVQGVADEKAPWSHIYLLTPTTFDNPNAKWAPMWVSVDGSMDKPFGWEAPGAAQVAKTGKPAGIVARVRDYTLLKPSDGAGA